MIDVISVDDHEMISFGLEKVFSETDDIRIATSCKSKAELEKVFENPGSFEAENLVCMIDIKLESDSGFDAADFLVARGVKCLMYSSYSNAGFIVKTMEHKIKGFLSKNADKSEILDAIRAVSRGETYIQKDLIPDMMSVSGILVTLTKKERELLDLIAEHLPNEVIAERMNLSKRSVENYVSRIFDKFNVKNRYELSQLL
ncbi:response regulator transcription factor [Treponema zioleckii]|uniref:response regulator transcription factor n=1 Tax=Treponema zioleckii TaxID=331680 RepID=UPI00168AB4DB|nr:response regulator transcription factor [Treponema zioleckii]